jgi:peptide/nickel transport system permease protein
VFRFFAHRAGHALAVLLIVTTAVFAALHLAGDPTAGFTAPGASPEERARIRARFGLDQPLVEQYVTYLSRAARGDLGESWRSREPALATVLGRLPQTLALGGSALGLALLIGLPLGIAAGAGRGRITRWPASGVALFGQALPGFVAGMLLILLFAVRLHWLPSSGGEGWRALLLPAAALALYPMATITRLIRASVSETMRAGYIRTAHGKGLPPRAVVLSHALRNACLPALAYVGIQAGFLAGGAIVVEGVFAYPGIGQLVLSAVTDRDLPVVQATVIVVACLVILVNLGVELIAKLLDPRLRFAGGAA